MVYDGLIKTKEEINMIKEAKSLFINNEVARIEITEHKTWFLICKDESGMMEATYKEFKQFVSDLSFVCLTSWNEELKEHYIDFVRYFSKL